MDTSSKKKIIILGTLAGLLLLASVVFSSSGNDVPAKTSTQPVLPSGPESNVGQSGVQYKGFAELSKGGLTQFQMEGIKYALYQYSKSATTFAIDPASIQQGGYDPENPSPTIPITFDMKIDDKPYKVKVDKNTDLVTVRVYLTTASDNKLVFDSQPIDSRTVKVPANTSVGD